MIFASTPFEECEGRMLYYKEHELKDRLQTYDNGSLNLQSVM